MTPLEFQKKLSLYFKKQKIKRNIDILIKELNDYKQLLETIK